jgi:ferritin-like metal-binding protein YciE
MLLPQTVSQRSRQATWKTRPFRRSSAPRQRFSSAPRLHPPSILGTNLRTMELNTLKDLYIHELKDLFSAEQQLVKALPKMAKAAANKELAAGFQQHLEQTKEHAQRLQQILSNHQQTTRGPKCKGMEGIVAEGAEMIAEEADEEVKDAGLIAAAQRVEHYEMAGYGTAGTYAELLGDKEGQKLLQTTLEEERQTDEKLSKLASSSINVAAAK